MYPRPDTPTLWKFILAAKEHLMTLLSGGIITVGLGLYERASGQDIPWQMYVYVVGVFILLTAYKVWQDTYRKAVRNVSVIFDVGTARQGKVCLINKAVLEPGTPTEHDGYILKATIPVRFANHNPQAAIDIWNMNFSLIHKTRLKENPIPLGGTTSFEVSLTINKGAREQTHHLRGFEAYIKPEYEKRLNKRHFLRLTIEAAGQAPYSADIYINWTEARKDEGFTLTPETKVQYLTHTLTE
jgi:hypothetical protein